MGNKWLAFVLLAVALTLLVIFYQVLPDQRAILLFTAMIAMTASHR